MVPFMSTQIEPAAAAMGKAVRGAIATAGLSQAQAAEASGIPSRSFSRRINGLLPFTWPEIVRIADATGVACSDLIASAERIAGRANGDAA